MAGGTSDAGSSNLVAMARPVPLTGKDLLGGPDISFRPVGRSGVEAATALKGL